MNPSTAAAACPFALPVVEGNHDDIRDANDNRVATVYTKEYRAWWVAAANERARAEKAEAEVKRLREALESIAEAYSCDREGMMLAVAHARAALEGGGQ